MSPPTAAGVEVESSFSGMSFSTAEPARTLVYDITLRMITPAGKTSWIEGDPTSFTLLVEP